MGQPIKLCTVANFINIHRTIFNWYYVTILGVSRRLNKPSPTEPLPPELAVPEEEGMIRVPKKDLKRAQGI